MENKDRRLTIGDIVNNPAFDVHCYVRVMDAANPDIQLMECYGMDWFPDYILSGKLSYITIQDGYLILEAEQEKYE